MALRDRLRTNTQPLLDPGEVIEQIAPARAGLNPWLTPIFGVFGIVGALFGLAFMAKWLRSPIIARTNQSLVILNGGMNGTKPKAILKRLPRDTPIGPLEGVWARTIIDGEKFWIHKKFHEDLIPSSPLSSGPQSSP
jgi:hypothetical protein